MTTETPKTELEVAAEALKTAHAAAQKTQAKLNASGEYWLASAFKAAEMKTIKANYATSDVIRDKEAAAKKAKEALLEAHKVERPIDYQRESALKEGFKALCQAIDKPSGAKTKIAGVEISTCANYREAVSKFVSEYEARIKAQAQPAKQ